MNTKRIHRSDSLLRVSSDKWGQRIERNNVPNHKNGTEERNGSKSLINPYLYENRSNDRHELLCHGNTFIEVPLILRTLLNKLFNIVNIIYLY